MPNLGHLQRACAWLWEHCWLKERLHCSDRELVEHFKENPYLQISWDWKLFTRIDRLMSRVWGISAFTWKRRLSTRRMKRLLQNWRDSGQISNKKTSPNLQTEGWGVRIKASRKRFPRNNPEKRKAGISPKKKYPQKKTTSQLRQASWWLMLTVLQPTLLTRSMYDYFTGPACKMKPC